MQPGLEGRVAARGELLQRAQRVVADLQTDVGGLLYELDVRLGTSFHHAVIAELPTIHAAVAAAPSPSSPATGPGGTGRQLLQAAQQRTALLQRAYNTISGLQQDVDACLAELGAGGAAGRANSPLPFPLLGTPGSTALADTGLQRPGADAARQQRQQQQQQQHQQQQHQQLFNGPLEEQPGPLQEQAQQQGLGMPPDLHPFQERLEGLRGPSAGSDGSRSPASGQTSGSTPPAQRLPQAPPLAQPVVLSPSTAAFVGAAFSARDTEAAEHAAQPRAVLNTSLKDATMEASRMATIRRNLAQQSVGHGVAAGSNLAGLFEQAAGLAAAEPAETEGMRSAAGGTPLLAASLSSVDLQQQPAEGADREAPASATSRMTAGPAHAVADAHAAALLQVLSALKAAQPGSLAASPLVASSLPTPAIRGPSQQLEAAFSAVPLTAAAATPAPGQPALAAQAQPPSQHVVLPPQPAACDSFERRMLAAARARSSTAEAPAVAASTQPSASPSDATEAYTRSSSTRTVLVLGQRASTSEPAGGVGGTIGGPSYEAALTAADAVAREISALLHQQEGEGQQLQPGSLDEAGQAGVDEEPVDGRDVLGSMHTGHAAGTCSSEHLSHALLDKPACVGHPALSSQPCNGDTAAGLGAAATLASAVGAAGSPAAAAAASTVQGPPPSASPAASREGAASSAAAMPATQASAAGSPAAGSPDHAISGSPAAELAQPATICGSGLTSASLERQAVAEEGSPAAAGRSSSGPASPCSEQWDELLDELEASTLGHGSAEAADSLPAPGWQVEQQAQLSSSGDTADEASVEAVGLAAGQPVAACTASLDVPPPQEDGQIAAPGMPSSRSGTLSAGSQDALLEGLAAATQLAGPAQRSLPSRLLGRLASHMQHDSVGSVAGEEHAAAAASGQQHTQGQALSASELLQPAAGAAGDQLAAAAEAADLAQGLLSQAHSVLQQEAADRQADAAAAEQAAVAAETRLQELQAEGLDAACAAGDAARLRAAAAAQRQAAAEAGQELAALEQDVLAVAAAAAEALHTPRGSAKASATKAAAAARALRLAAKWAAASGSGILAAGSSSATGAPHDPMPAVAALLERLESHAEPLSTLSDACGQHKAGALKPVQPPVQEVWWLTQGQQPQLQPTGQPPPAGRQQQQQQQQQLVPLSGSAEEAACARCQAPQAGDCEEAAGSSSMGGCSVVEVFSGGQDTAAPAAAGPSSAASGESAEQGDMSMQPPECSVSPAQQQGQPQVPQQPAAAATCTSSSGDNGGAWPASSAPEGLPLSERTQAAAAAMLGKQERALARAAAAELEALRLVAGGWHDAAAAAAASAAKWRRRAGNMGRVAELALRHAAGPLSDPPLEGPASAAVGGIAAPLAAPEKAVTPEGAASGGAHIMQQASGSVGQQGVAGGSSSQRPGVQPSGSVSPAKGAAVVHAAMGLQQDDQQGSLDTSCSKPSVQFEEGLGGSSLVPSSAHSRRLKLPCNMGSSSPSPGRYAQPSTSSTSSSSGTELHSSSANDASPDGHSSSSSSSSFGRASSRRSSKSSGGTEDDQAATVAPSSSGGGHASSIGCRPGLLEAHHTLPGHPEAESAEQAGPTSPAGVPLMAAARRPVPRPLPAFCLPQPQALGSHDTPAVQAALGSSSSASVAQSGTHVAAATAAHAAAGTAAAANFGVALPVAGAAAERSASVPIRAGAQAQARRSPDPQAAATACANPASRASSDERLQTALDRLEAQLARSKRQQAAAATVVADAHHRAASDMAGGICWLSGFGGGHRGSSP